jgi:hypothetical protein
VPLDTLESLNAPGTPVRESSDVDERDGNEGASSSEPLIGQTVKSSSGVLSVVDAGSSSPVHKRQKLDDEMAAETGPVDSPSEESSSPQFRDVVIKKKVVVSEYEMNENGEMIVRDVEKMVEEIVREPVKSKPAPPSISSIRSGTSGQSSGPKKAPKAGQATLTGFFKPRG